MEWRHSGSPRPKKFQVQKSAGKVLASIFWDQDSILLTDYLPKGQTINAEYYSSLLVQLKDILKKTPCHGKVTKRVLFLHNNAPAHQALATQKKLAYLGFQCLNHPSYFPDLVLSDYHLFPGLKNNWKVTNFHPRQKSLLLRKPGWMDNLLNFFFFEWLPKVRATSYEVFWASWGVCWINPEFGHCSLFPSLSGQGLISTPSYVHSSTT